MRRIRNDCERIQYQKGACLYSWMKKAARQKAKESNHTSQSLLTSQGATNGWGLGVQAGPPLRQRLSRFPSSIAIRYSQDGIILSLIFQGSTDSAMFKDFIKQLLQHYEKWPEPNSVLVMDNASFHHTKKTNKMCLNAGGNWHIYPEYIQAPPTQ